MTAAAPSDTGAPRPKTPMPPLDTRAPRPAVVRLRRGVVVGVVLAAAGLLAGSLAWAFVVQPELRARARDAHLEDRRPSDVRGAVRPSERVTDAPATYAQLGRLPEPRRLGAARPDAADRPAPRAPPPAGRGAGKGLADEARGSGLFFGGGGPRGSARPTMPMRFWPPSVPMR